MTEHPPAEQLLAGLPASIQAHIDPTWNESRPKGRLDTVMHRVRLVDRTTGYLKWGEGVAGADLRAESERLRWLAERITVPVPQVVEEQTQGGRTYQLLTELPGVPSYDEGLRSDMEAVVRGYARALRAVHDVDWSDTPFTGTLAKELAEAERRVRENEIDLHGFLADSHGREPELVLKWLDERRHILDEDLVFTHGDYCMPNILMDAPGHVSGIVDWGQAGVADRHRDLFGVTTSLPMNYGDGWEAVFCDEYGITDIDEDRVLYTFALDWFFIHHDS